MKRTHRVAFYRPVEGQDPDTGRERQVYPDVPDAASVQANVQTGSGEVRRGSTGAVVERDGRAFVDRTTLDGFLPEEDDGLRVEHGPGAEHWEVVNVRDQGEGWDVELDLVLSQEAWA